MKNFIVIIVFLAFMSSAFAQLPARKFDNMPKGTFKKTRTGKIIQYDSNGKKVGTYKLNNGRFTKTK